ncbi:MAG TPA: hypothetical protein VF524_05075 [Polyangia bacterium]
MRLGLGLEICACQRLSAVVLPVRHVDLQGLSCRHHGMTTYDRVLYAPVIPSSFHVYLGVR